MLRREGEGGREGRGMEGRLIEVPDFLKADRRFTKYGRGNRREEEGREG